MAIIITAIRCTPFDKNRTLVILSLYDYYFKIVLDLILLISISKCIISNMPVIIIHFRSIFRTSTIDLPAT